MLPRLEMEAETLVKLKPNWSQGYQRLGEALMALQEFEEAEDVNFCLCVCVCQERERERERERESALSRSIEHIMAK